MPRFVVRVGYERVTPYFREVEVDAADAAEASRNAIALSHSENEFWSGAVDGDGEAGPTAVIEIRPAQAD